MSKFVRDDFCTMKSFKLNMVFEENTERKKNSFDIFTCSHRSELCLVLFIKIFGRQADLFRLCRFLKILSVFVDPRNFSWYKRLSSSAESVIWLFRFKTICFL